MRVAFLLAALFALAAACGDDSDAGQRVVAQFTVEGAGMQPSLPHGTVVDVLDYGSIQPQRGDVIVFQYPVLPNRDFIKRIIGVAGDTIEIDPEENQVLVNGEIIDEPYVQGPTTCFSQCEFVVPADSYFVLGDNRPNSSDSRQGWFVPKENIIGLAQIPE